MSILNKIIKEDKSEENKTDKKVIKADNKAKASDNKKKDVSGAKKVTPVHYFELITRPHISEKAFDINENRQYVFVVSPDANKSEVKKAIENFYKVSVSAVNITNVPGKTKRYKGRLTKQSGFKKAVVTLKEGGKIDVMEATK